MQILLTVAYDGTNYSGWQRQQNAVAVQQKLEEALSSLLCQPITTNAASRTDAGVHALGQRAAFFVETSIPVAKFPQALSRYLPPDISITAAQPVSDDFNPRFDAKYKTYSYNIYTGPYSNPLLNRYSIHVLQPLDVAAMISAASSFIGRHDFSAFMATGSSAKTTVREIYACDIAPTQNGQIALTVTGNGFLYNMVRIIAGTLLYVGIGKLPPDSIPKIIQSRDRTQAGKTLPPQGLTLVEVGYTDFVK